MAPWKQKRQKGQKTQKRHEISPFSPFLPFLLPFAFEKTVISPLKVNNTF
jgi:hypothetical protein